MLDAVRAIGPWIVIHFVLITSALATSGFLEVARLKTPPFRAGIQPTIPTQPTVNGKAGYSTPTTTINRKALITSYEARK